MHDRIKKNNNGGFSLVESLVSIAIFAVLSVAIYQTSALLIKGIGAYRENTTISSLAGQYMEVVHNLPYSAVGTLSGNPHGNLPDEPNAPVVKVNGVDYKIYYVVNYIDNPADGTALAGTDFASNDYKQVKLYVKNVSSAKIYSFLTNITPKGLENLESGGALSVKVFDAVGQPVPNATINILNTAIIPNINLTRTTDSNGNWIEVGLPNSANSYHITATKVGYSNDATYPITELNPNPTKPDSTIADGQVTQLSFSIDKLSTLAFRTLNQICAPLSGVSMEVQGGKLIGNPNLLKFDHYYTSDSEGNITTGSIEWDNYIPALAGSNLMIYGSSPIQAVTVLPDTHQEYTLILGPKSANRLLVTVKDTATGNPVEGAEVRLQETNLNFDLTKQTGGSVWSSNDWTGGTGQADFIDPTKYFADDTGISSSIIPTALRLLSYDNGATYVSSGALISSTYDTGTNATSFTTLDWQPTSQNPNTEIKFQLATNNDKATTTWNFIGPDGTSESFYTTPGTAINVPNARYVRYKVFLSTNDSTKTPVLTSANINYVSGCFTPGQVMFPGLASSTDYQITVNAPNYTAQTISPISINGNMTKEVQLYH